MLQQRTRTTAILNLANEKMIANVARVVYLRDLRSRRSIRFDSTPLEAIGIYRGRDRGRRAVKRAKSSGFDYEPQ